MYDATMPSATCSLSLSHHPSASKAVSKFSRKRSAWDRICTVCIQQPSSGSESRIRRKRWAAVAGRCGGLEKMKEVDSGLGLGTRIEARHELLFSHSCQCRGAWLGVLPLQRTTYYLHRLHYHAHENIPLVAVVRWVRPMHPCW